MEIVAAVVTLAGQLFPSGTPAIDHYTVSITDSANKTQSQDIPASSVSAGQSSLSVTFNNITDGGNATITAGQYADDGTLIGTLVTQTVSTPPGTVSLNIVTSIAATATPAL
jgi:hypothetical protein